MSTFISFFLKCVLTRPRVSKCQQCLPVMTLRTISWSDLRGVTFLHRSSKVRAVDVQDLSDSSFLGGNPGHLTMWLGLSSKNCRKGQPIVRLWSNVRKKEKRLIIVGSFHSHKLIYISLLRLGRWIRGLAICILRRGCVCEWFTIDASTDSWLSLWMLETTGQALNQLDTLHDLNVNSGRVDLGIEKIVGVEYHNWFSI